MKRIVLQTKLVHNKLVILIIFICSGFLMSMNNKRLDTSLESIILKASDHQLDILMTVWYDSFHSYQAEGRSANDADQLACIDAVKAIEDYR